MRFDWWTLALQTINFAILVWLLHRFLYRPVLGMIETRRAEVEKQYADAAEAETGARNELAAIEAERAGIAAERTATLKAAAEEAERAAATRRAEAERRAAALLEETRKALAAERDRALAEMRRTALDLGADIARRLLAEVPTPLRAEAWLERVEQHLAALAPAEREELADGLDAGALRVVTAVPLPEPVMSEWRGRLARALGGRAATEFDVDDALLAGVELHFPSAVLRFSWQSALADMQAEIEDHGDAR